MRCEYISDDGKFRSEDEYAVDEYEFNTIISCTGITWCDSEGKDCDLEDAWYIYVPTEDAMPKVRSMLYERFGIELPEGLNAGHLGYDEEDEVWHNIDDQITKMNHKIEELKLVSRLLDKRVIGSRGTERTEA